jgi:regulator of protease activity HflC (stomatin/prohibitin superfamily)
MIRFVLGVIFLIAALSFFGVSRVLTGKTYGGTEKKKIATLAAIPLAILAVLLLGFSTVRIVPSNTVGIPTTFGSIGQAKGAGFHLTAPWTSINTFSTRVQESSMLDVLDEGDRAKKDAIEVRGSDGYQMRVDITIRYFIEEKSASALFRLVGSETGIRERLVRPEAREAVRVVFAKFTAEEGYTSQREAIRTEIEADLAKRLLKYGLRLDTVNVRNVAPDPVLASAISDRAKAREQALQAEITQKTQVTEAETRRKVAETDAKAKVIAAQGEADSNAIITASLTPELLTLKQIEALEKANTVYIPAGSQVLVSQVPK